MWSHGPAFLVGRLEGREKDGRTNEIGRARVRMRVRSTHSLRAQPKHSTCLSREQARAPVSWAYIYVGACVRASGALGDVAQSDGLLSEQLERCSFVADYDDSCYFVS